MDNKFPNWLINSEVIMSVTMVMSHDGYIITFETAHTNALHVRIKCQYLVCHPCLEMTS